LIANLVNEKKYPDERVYANAQLSHTVAVSDKFEQHRRQGQHQGASVRYKRSHQPFNQHDAAHLGGCGFNVRGLWF